MSIKRLMQNPWLLAVSLALNIALIAGFSYTLQKAQLYYKEYRMFRPMAHGVSQASNFELPASRTQKLMVIYGDSRVQEWKPHPQLDDTLIVNAGISGEMTTEMRRRLEHDVLRLKPDVVMIQAGMNDLTAAATRGVANPEKIITTMKTNFRFMIDTLIDQNIEVIVTPVIPATPLGIGRKLFWHDKIDSLLNDTNTFLKRVADEHQLQWIDLLAPLYDEKGKLRSDWYVDTLHLYEANYQSLNQTVEKALSAQ